MRVLLVSKPLTLPMHDGSQCLVRDLATELSAVEPIVMGVRGEPVPFPATARRIRVAPVYSKAGQFAPSLRANARALWAVLTDRDADLWHFVFAPNRRAALAVQAVRRVRATPVVQTIASPPRSFLGIQQSLFGDVVVAQSEWTRARLQEQGVDDVELVRPGAPDVTPPSADEVRALRARLQVRPSTPLIVYPGDLEWSGGAQRLARAIPDVLGAAPGSVFVFACRKKTPDAERAEAELRARLPSENVRFVGELPSILPLLTAARVVVFPVDSGFGKVDIPVVVLEAMRLSVPVVTSDHGPLRELNGTISVPVHDLPVLVREVLSLLNDGARRAAVASAQREFVERHLRKDHAARQYETIYEQLAS